MDASTGTGGKPTTPAAWLPYNITIPVRRQFSNSPTRPILLKSGPYAGQMISGDVYLGGILRYQVEKVNDEWQGAAFTFQNAGKDVPVGVTSATLSADGNHVHLKLASLLTRRMYAINVKGVTSATGNQELSSNMGFYTLNSVSPDSGSTTRLVGLVGDFSRRIHASLHQSRVAFDVPFHGLWKIELVRPDGTCVAKSAGFGPGRFESVPLPPGLYLVACRAEGAAFSEKVQVR